MNLAMPSFEICDRARMARDARFDGLFFTAVKSTGIYCRPVCPAPSPKPTNIVYYPNAAAASSAGFRPCLRCRPELAPNAMQHRYQDVWVNRALAFIAEGELQEGSVETLAAKIGLSARQIRRLFLKELGATPIAVHTTRRLLLAKQLLTETAMPMTHIALASGFKSLRRFNAAFSERCKMAPSAIRRLRTEAPSGSLILRLAYRPPFDFSLMLAFLAKRAIPGIERVTKISYERVLGPLDGSTWIRVTAASAKPELTLEISDTDPRLIHDIVQRTRRLFDLDAELHAVHAVLSASDLLRKAIDRRPGLRVPGSWDGFELAVRAVLGQQNSVASATTLAKRLVAQYGEQRVVQHAHLDRAFPSPEAIANAPLEQLGLPKSRAATLRSMAQAIINGDINFQSGQNLEAFALKFTRLLGIGPWTAQYVAMRALRQPDAFPAGDLILQQVMGGAKRLSEKQTEARSQAWRPWRAYAVLHLWHLSGDILQENPTKGSWEKRCN